MAKQKPKISPASLLDFEEENMLENLEEPQLEEDPIVDEEEEEEEPQPTPQPKKKVVKKVEQKQEEVEEEEEPNPDSNQEQHQEEEEQVATQDFWEEVSRITGTEVEVDYGDIDPISPQGAALREKAVAAKAIDDFVAKLEEEYPAAYQALEYATAGGDLRELYKGEKDYSKIQIADDDEDHARGILSEYYSKKGFNDARIKRMVAADAESEEGLVGTAKAALVELAQEQEEERQIAIQEAQEAKKREREQDQKFLNSINGLLAKGQLDTFKVPKQDIQDFYAHLKGVLQRDGQGGYLLVTPVDQTQLEKQLQAEYFKFKKGDLSQLIQIKATTAATQKLRLKLDKPENTPRSTNTANLGGTMKDLET